MAMFPSKNRGDINTIQGKLLSFLEGRESKETDADAVAYLYLQSAYNILSSLLQISLSSMHSLANSCALSL